MRKESLYAYRTKQLPAGGVLELELDRMNMERKQLALKPSKCKTTGLEISTVEQCKTSAVGLLKHVKELQDMDADEAMIAAGKCLVWNAMSTAGVLTYYRCKKDT
jgi:hypothetical protein